ncbi:hypothetical protein HT576_10665 [Haloterrigena sp. SYSU A121-1]|uniref:Uncharacterized protein n=1 Tax=Haloterrigena gelatinilytica TaxID=2741724 RepID=A0A8J8KBM3_9EURY|nr:hypothetical protein [Haloterrigena gelatinilytica]NUB91480.1 hypothetical protein [Haloterrigena gelatinilytica]
MAPAIVHFLVGASILLVLATPVALHDERVRRVDLWLVLGGGVWGLGPDLHNVAPAFRSQLHAFHDSLWAVPFAFHYALDSQAVRARPLAGIAGSILLFCLAVGGFTAAARADPERARRTKRFVSRLGIPVAALAAAAILGTMLAATGRVETVAALVGADGTLASAALLLVASVAGSYAVAVVVPDRYARRPFVGSLLGLQLGLVAWVVGIVLVLPLWARVVLEASPPVPLVDWPSLLALAVAGTLVGACVTTVRRVALPAPADR